MAGIVGAIEDDIRRQGRWNNTTMNGAHLTSLPRKMMRSMTGFLTNGRFFYIPHASLDPPTSLCKKVFLAIEEWHDRLAAKELIPDISNPIQRIVTANVFVQLILIL
jgi:hypothetical protein